MPAPDRSSAGVSSARRKFASRCGGLGSAPRCAGGSSAASSAQEGSAASCSAPGGTGGVTGVTGPQGVVGSCRRRLTSAAQAAAPPHRSAVSPSPSWWRVQTPAAPQLAVGSASLRFRHGHPREEWNGRAPRQRDELRGRDRRARRARSATRAGCRPTRAPSRSRSPTSSSCTVRQAARAVAASARSSAPANAAGVARDGSWCPGDRSFLAASAERRS